MSKVKEQTWPEVVAAAKKNPFANCKPRSEWRTPVRKLRVFEEVEVAPGVVKLAEFRLRGDGLHVRFKHGRREVVWPYAHLANGVAPGGQMKLL